MSIANFGNRPQLLRSLGNITADATFLVLHAHKQLVIRKASIVGNVAVAAGVQANHVAFKLIERTPAGAETDVGAAVTNVGVAVGKGATLDLTVPEDFKLEAGNSLVLSADVMGTGAFSQCHVSIDYQVQGSRVDD